MSLTRGDRRPSSTSDGGTAAQEDLPSAAIKFVGEDARSDPTTAAAGPDDGVPTNAHGAKLPTWIAGLPAPARFIVMQLYGEMLREDDDFSIRMRKVVLGASMLLTLPVVGTTVYNSQTLEAYGAAGIIVMCSCATFLLGWAAVFAFARVTGNASAVVADAWIGVTTVGLALVTISAPDFDIYVSCIGAASIAMMLHTPRLPLHLLALFVVTCAAWYNGAVYERGPPLGEFTLLTVPDPIMRGTWTRLFNAGALVGASVIMLGGLFFYTKESENARRQACDAAFASEVAKRLGRYDTEAAFALLNLADEPEAAESTSASVKSGERRRSSVKLRCIRGVNDELVTTFRVLTANLDKFRPHIPNWLMDQVKEDEDDGNTADPGDKNTPGQLVAFEESVDDPDLAADISTIGSHSGRGASDSLSDIPRTGSDQSLRATGYQPSPRTPVSPHRSAFGTPRMTPGRGQLSPQSPALQTKNPSSRSFLLPGVLCSRQGAMVRVSFRALSATSNISTAGTASPTPRYANGIVDALHALVDGAHELAHSSKAALHGFVGDELVVTWNAASRAVQPEAKAMRFLWRLRAMLSRRAGDVLSVTGAGMAGPMQVLLAGQGRTQALTVSSRWQSSLDVLYRAAQEAGTVLVDRGLHSAASYACRARLVAAVQVAPPPDSAGKRRFSSTSPMLPNAPAAGSASPLVPAVVYGSQVLSPTSGRCLAAMELTGEVDDTKGEWMYVLKQNADTAGASQSPKQDQRSRDTDAAWSTVAGVVEDIIKGNDDVFESNAGRIHVLASAAADDGGSVGTNRTLCWAIGLLCAIADSRASI